MGEFTVATEVSTTPVYCNAYAESLYWETYVHDGDHSAETGVLMRSDLIQLMKGKP
jgi:hypothetical protein